MNTNLNLVRKALLSLNYFQFDGSNGINSLKNLKNASKLESIIIRIEKSSTIHQYDFQYNPEKCKFIRLNETENTEHYTAQKKCRECSIQCFKNEYSISEFIELCKNVFEPVSVELT